MKLIVKNFFLADFYLSGVSLDLDKYIFPWQTSFLLGGCTCNQFVFIIIIAYSYYLLHVLALCHGWKI
jgi:hypothetical protein